VLVGLVEEAFTVAAESAVSPTLIALVVVECDWGDGVVEVRGGGLNFVATFTEFISPVTRSTLLLDLPITYVWDVTHALTHYNFLRVEIYHHSQIFI